MESASVVTPETPEQSLGFEEVQEKVGRLQKLVMAAVVIVVALSIGLSIWIWLNQMKVSITSTQTADEVLSPEKHAKKTRWTKVTTSTSANEENKDDDRDNSEVCNTEDCQYMRRLIEVSVDQTLPPCDNFYAYVCNGALRNVEGLKVGFILLTTEKTKQLIIQWLMHGPRQRGSQTGFQKVLDLYDSCTDATSGKAEKNRRYIQKFLVLHKLALNDRLDFEPLSRDVEFMFIGFPVILRVHMTAHRETNEVYLTTVYKGGLVKTRGKEPRQESERKGIVEKVIKFVFSLDKVDEGVVNSILRAEDKMLELEPPDEDAAVVPLVFPMSQMGLTEVNDIGLAARWNNALEKYKSLLPGDPSTVKVEMTRERIVFLHNVHGSFPRIDKNLLRILIAWGVTYDLYEMTGFQDSAKEPEVIRERCYTAFLKDLPSAFPVKVMLETVNSSRLDAVELMSESITREINASFEASHWLDDATRKLAMEKLSRTVRVIGYTFNLTSPEAVNDHLKHVHGLTDTHIENRVVIWKANAAASWERMQQENAIILAMNYGLQFFVPVANALNMGRYDGIYVPAGIMYPPFFLFQGPPEVNYGSLGFVFAHELMHSYDNSITYPERNGSSIEYFTNSSLNAYHKFERCIQSASTKAPKGRNFLHRKQEYLADSLAMQSLTRAYKKAAENSRVTLGNVKGLTRDQLFYISHCIKWCGDLNLTASPTHPDHDERCNIPLMDSDHFSAVFSCPPGSPMNPPEKCQFW